jgi:serine phosphatase RsbU (regulator of sigma subunit)/ketosteroid isomerase-like protein
MHSVVPLEKRELASRREAPVSAVENKALVRRYLDAHAKGDLAAVEKTLAPDFVNHNPLPGQKPDREGYLRSFTEYHAAFANSRYVIEKQVAEGDEVMTSFTASASHDRGEWMDLVPTGKGFEAQLFLVHRIAAGKITDEWSQGSGLAELTQRRLDQELRERERIEQELRVARRIQQALLPEGSPELTGWEIYPHYQPAREVGGDFYDFLPLADGRVGFIVGDATGKGVPAAVLMASTQSVLRALVHRGDSAPGQVLAEANEVLFTFIPRNMFVTCFYAILDPSSGRLLYANAGHDLPYLHRSGDAEELRAKGMPLGLMPGMSYEEKEIVLEAGESVLFYSDGLVEAHDPKGEMFGFPQLRALFAEYGEDRTLVDSLLEELYSFTGEGWEQEDDITLLTLRCSAPLS